MTLIKLLKKSRAVRTVLFFLLGASVGFLILTAALFGGFFWFGGKYQGRVYPGVFLFSQDMAGKARGEVLIALEKMASKTASQKAAFVWQNEQDKKWEIAPQAIDFALDVQGTADLLLGQGKTKDGKPDIFGLYWLLVSPQSIRPKYTYSQQKLEIEVRKIADEVNRPSQDALFEFKNSKVTSFQVSKEGRETDRRLAEKLLLLAFSRENPDPDEVALALPVEIISPKITTEQTNQLGVKELLAEGESFFTDSIPSRVHNIILASSYLHGVVIAPGEVFSFSEKVGTISAQTGYKQAYIIKDGKTVLEDGGGVCQVATTLFRAALNAGLPVLERQAHYYRVGFYEQGGYLPGLDATVYPPSPDFKFRNDTPAHILIQTFVDESRKRLVLRFFGTSDDRKVEVAKPVIHSQTPPPDPVYVDEPSLPSGVTKRVDVAHWGAKVSVTRKVWDAKGGLKEEKTWWSNYMSWPAVYQRGTGV